MIGLGSVLITRFHWIIYLFGAFLVYTGIKMATQQEHDIEPKSNPIIRLIRKVLAVTNHYHGQNFFVRQDLPGKGLKWVATPLFVVLVVVETTDLIFAVDSVPAIGKQRSNDDCKCVCNDVDRSENPHGSARCGGLPLAVAGVALLATSGLARTASVAM